MTNQNIKELQRIALNHMDQLTNNSLRHYFKKFNEILYDENELVNFVIEIREHLKTLDHVNDALIMERFGNPFDEENNNIELKHRRLANIGL